MTEKLVPTKPFWGSLVFSSRYATSVMPLPAKLPTPTNFQVVGGQNFGKCKGLHIPAAGAVHQPHRHQAVLGIAGILVLPEQVGGAIAIEVAGADELPDRRIGGRGEGDACPRPTALIPKCH
jgi:hypothetical protein